MSSSESDPQRDTGQPPPTRKESGREELPERELLEKVLRETLRDHSPDAMDPADLDALRQVAQHYRGQPLVLEPITVELVEAVLGVQFPDRPQASPSWKAMSESIAQSLFDDPASRQRLEGIWTRLAEISP